MQKSNTQQGKQTRELRTDGEVTRARILEAAGELFASTGYAETTNKAVAALADVDLASINYHFGSRAGLYQATLIEAHQRFLNRFDLQHIIESNLLPKEKLLSLIELFVERALKHPQPWHLQMLAREVLAPTSHLKILFEQEAAPKQVLIKQLLSDITGIPAEDPTIMHCVLNIVAPCLMLLVGNRMQLGTAHDVSKIGTQATVQHLYTFALGGLEAIANKKI